MLHNLQNKTLKIAAVEFFPIFSFQGGNNYTGVSFEILKILALALNFSYEITEVSPGGRIIDGSWTKGVVKDIYDSKYDIGLDVVSMTYERYEAVAFTFPFMFDKAAIISPTRTKTNRTFAIVQVFTPEVWIFFLISVAIFGPVMKLVEIIRKKFNPNLPQTEQAGIYSYLWISVCMALFKGVRPFKGVAPRIIILFWTAMLMIMVAMYSGILLALLSEPTLSIPIDNLEELVQAPGMSWGVFPSSATRVFIETSNKPSYIQISKEFNKTPDLNPRNISMATNLLRTNHYALISDEIIFKNIRVDEVKRTGNCPYYISSDHLFTQWYSFITHKNCSYLSSINSILHNLIESGLTDFWLKEALGTDLDVCDSGLGADLVTIHNLRLADMQGAFIVLSLGILTSFICLFVEFFVRGKEITKKRFKRKLISQCYRRRIVLKEEVLNY